MNFTIMFLLLTIVLLSNQAIAQVYQYTDENGRTVYSNVAPPQGAKLIQNKESSTKNSSEEDEKLISSYHQISNYLKNEIIGQRNGTKTDLDEQTRVLGELDKYFSGRIANRKESISSKVQKNIAITDSIQAEARVFKDNGNTTEFLLLARKAQICRMLGMKMMVDEYLVREKIPYQEIDIPEEACLKLANKFSVASSNKKEVAGGNMKGQASSTTSIKSYCEQKWKGDYEMLEFCIKEQSNALGNISRLKGPILDKCKAKWNDDYEMVEYCTNQQTEAFNNVSRLSGHIFDSCKAKWADDYEMVEYCVKEQSAAQKRLEKM